MAISVAQVVHDLSVDHFEDETIFGDCSADALQNGELARSRHTSIGYIVIATPVDIDALDWSELGEGFSVLHRLH
jgi:hypothetical protein